jgi:RNA polymerase sigma factor (sigma-70 family)
MEAAETTVLVRRAAQGDRMAWDDLVVEYAGLVGAVVRSFRLREAQAADAAQMTWLRLVEHLTDIREPERLAGWLRTTARRVCLETIRESGREQLTDWSDEPLSTAVGRYGDVEDKGPEASAVRRQQQALVRGAVATLPARHQALLALLVSLPHVSYEEISARLDMPIGSIGPTRARILARLRQVLEAADLHDLALS